MAKTRRAKKMIFTIGHSTRPLKEFLRILKAYEVDLVVDIRHFPGSRRFPHFKKERLEKNLPKHGIDYVHLEVLGGRRSPIGELSKNLAWRNRNFRGYADYMQTKEFKAGLKELMEMARSFTLVIMCAEAVPWRCHRSLVGDALLARGFKVEDIFSEKISRPHKLTPFAEVYRRQVSYPLRKDHPAVH